MIYTLKGRTEVCINYIRLGSSRDVGPRSVQHGAQIGGTRTTGEKAVLPSRYSRSYMAEELVKNNPFENLAKKG